MSKKSFMIEDKLLDPYERKILNKRTDESYVVKGCAGSGKSLIALIKAADLQAQGKTYLVLLYNLALKQYMKDAILEMKLDPDCITTYGKCFRFSKDEKGNWEIGEWKKGSFDYIIVDEAQDFSGEALEKIKSHCDKILFFGDSAQSLYPEFSFDNNPTLSIESIAQKFALKTEQLIINHRMPKTIARIAACLNTDDDVLEERCFNDGIDKPKIIGYNSLEAQLKDVAKIIQNKNLEDVGIFAFHRKKVDKIAELLKDLGLTPEKYYSDQNMELNFETSNPKVTTFHSSKGLQFETVFIIDCDNSIDVTKVKPLYVAMTRSYQDLYIMYTGQLTSLLDTIRKDDYDTSIEGKADDDFLF